MESVTRVMATTHEVSLKGGNRRWFERHLGANVRRALADLPLEGVDRPAWRILVRLAEPVSFTEVARRLATVFGINAILPVEPVGDTIAEVTAHLAGRLDGLTPRSFAVRCTRSDKLFPMTSVEIEREVGGFVKERTGWNVDLERPDLTIRLLLDVNGFWVWLRRVAGPGGLPVGTGGRALCLLSGGIDSPVAAALMLKRGMRVDFVHFHSVPQTDPASLEKAADLVRVLNRYQPSARLVLVPLLDIQELVVARCPAALRVLLYRRFMLRLADRVAGRLGARALVTGESLGQVASQTVENLAAVDTVANLPVLRPLIGMDKQEIIVLARRLGSYDVSIRPHFDCCSYLLPDRPATRAEAAELAKAEEALDIHALLRAALAGSESRRVADAVPWSEIPVPPELGA